LLTQLRQERKQHSALERKLQRTIFADNSRIQDILDEKELYKSQVQNVLAVFEEQNKMYFL